MQDPDNALYQLNHYKPLIDRAIKITEDYVSEHKLVLTGGMAIDLALRANGKSIYDDDTLPDYDIISDKNIEHANALAEIMCKAGLPDINVINAVHITTVRVRMKNIVFLDATYIPPSLFPKIPYLDIGHLRVVHPHYQFIDQRSSLSNLMADTGISLNIFNRLIKDVHRNNLLRDEYPIEHSKSKVQTRVVKIPLDLIKINDMYLTEVDPLVYLYTGPACITGFAGCAIMVALFNNTLDQLVITDKYLEVPVPVNMPVSIISCNIKLLSSFIKNPTTYRPLLQLKPVTQRCGDFEFIDTYGSRVSCNIIELPNGMRICVGSVDYLLMEMLRDRVYTSVEPFSSYYSTLIAIVDKMREDSNSSSVWWPSLNCYGQDNLPEYKALAFEKLMNPDIANTLKPRTSYPRAPKCATRSGFEHETSHYFRIDGTEDNSLKHTSYAYIIESFNEYVDKKRNENI